MDISKKTALPRFQMKPVMIDGVSAVEADTALTFGRHMHDQFGIGVIGRGAQTSLSGRGVVEAYAGNTITVNPGEVHDGSPIGDGGRSWKMLYFDTEMLADMFYDMTEGRTRDLELSYPVTRDVRVAGRYRILYAALTAGSIATHRLLAEESLFYVLGQLSEDGKMLKATPSVSRAIAAARSKIDSEPAAALTLGNLAQLCGLSRFQVLRGFTRATGLTPHAYMMQRRLQMARRLIGQGDGLADAASSSGFADQSHMTRLFVRTFGVSPGQYAAARR